VLLRNDLDFLQFLLTCGADPNVHSNTKSLLSVAIESNSMTGLRMLIDGGALVTGRACPPLVTAVKLNHARAAEILLESGASLAEQFHGKTVGQYALKKKSTLFVAHGTVDPTV
jgi:hypothetical protein